MFAYCLNSPVSHIDTIGQFSVDFFGNEDNELFSSDDLGFGSDSGGDPWDEFMVYLDYTFRGLDMAMGNRPNTTQNHHMFSNKHSKFTPQYKEIFEMHNAKLTQKENITELPGHSGRHTEAYHEGMLDVLNELASIAKGDYEMFIIGLGKIGEYMQEHPGLPYAK